MRSRIVVFLILLVLVFVPIGTAYAVHLDVGVYEEYALCMREAAAIWVADTGNQVQIHAFPHSQLMQFPARGGMDVLVPSCNRSADIWEQKGFVDPATRKPMFCGRMSVIVAPQNPLNVKGIEDFDRRDIRWGKINFCAWRGEKILKNKGELFVADSNDSTVMMDLLAAGKVDAVLGWDYAVAGNPLNPVVMRIPTSSYGSELAAFIPAFVAKNARQPKEAAVLVQFLSTDARAQRIYLAHGLMLNDGMKEIEYDTGAGTRMMDAYTRICRQVVDEYKLTTGTALDIGCGPGQMTLELTKASNMKVIGLDIEPEAIELARAKVHAVDLDGRVQFVCADAHSLPIADNSIDFILSRGTLPFLRNQVAVIQEMFRVLKPGGVAFIGGGFGRGTTHEEKQKMRGHFESWYGIDPISASKDSKAMFPFPILSYDILMTKAGIGSYRVVTDGGNWLEIRK